MREAAARHPEAKRVELWFEDEARIGQKGRTTHVWYQRGRRPRGLREQRFASVQLFGAVCPERGAPATGTRSSRAGRAALLTNFPWLPASVTDS